MKLKWLQGMSVYSLCKSAHVYCLCFVLSLLGPAVYAQKVQIDSELEQDVKVIINAALTVMSFTVLPEVSASSISIDKGRGEDPGLRQSTIGGGFTYSKNLPLYLEGRIGLSQYDAKFIATNGEENRPVELNWQTESITGGVGWDFALNQNKDFVIRPILNFTLGTVRADTEFGQWLADEGWDIDPEDFTNAKLDSWGVGGALMLAYHRVRERDELDVEMRYTAIPLYSFTNNITGVSGESLVNAMSVWGRWRAQTGVNVFELPLRYVLESSASEYFGPQRGALGFDSLYSVGAGLELDTSKHISFISRARIVARYMFGEKVSGHSIGMAVSF